MPTGAKISTAMIVLVFAAFVSIGLPDALFGSAWPSIRVEFGMGNAAVGLLNIPGSLAYIASSAMLGSIMSRVSIAQLLSGSTALVGLGLTIYALAPTFWAIIPAVMLISAGSGAIDAALNLFAAQNLPARYMSWLHAFYGMGALAGPFVMALVFSMNQSWRWGYAIIAMILWLMALVFVVTHSQWTNSSTDDEREDEHSPLTGGQVLRMPRVQLSFLMMMGGAIIEALAAVWIASLLINRFGVSQSTGAIALGIYWIALTGARVLVPIIWSSAPPLRIQRWSTWIVLIAALVMLPDSPELTWIGVTLVGLGIASIFPVAMTITADRFGPSVSTHAVGYMVSASTFMFAIMPPISGWLADQVGFVIIPVLLLGGAVLLLITQVLLEHGDTPAIADRL